MRFLSAVVLSLLALPAAAKSDPQQILSITQRVADWQLAHLNDTSIVNARPETFEPRGWVQGAFYIGLSALADVSPDANDKQAIVRAGEREGFQLGPRPYHADDHVIAQTWIWAYEHFRDPKMIAPVRERFDAILAKPPANGLEFREGSPGMEAWCQDRWCWSDALFMAPPGWFELSRATEDPKYRAYADKEYWATVDALYDKQEHLFYRDSRFFTRKGPHGEKVFWSRGNGWVYAGLARIISFLPADAPERGRSVDLFRQMSDKLVSLQKPDGYWPVSLEGPPEGTPPETSGTGFFTFGLAYGVASGILTDLKYRAAAERGWTALVKAVEPDGKLGWVQQIGYAPDQVHRQDTQLYGTGAFLLAGAAMIDMARADQAVRLTIHNPKALTREAARIAIPASLLPRKMEGDWVAVVGAHVALVQPLQHGAITALDLPGAAEIPLLLRPRFGSDPPPYSRMARATIPVKQGDGYTEVQRFVVPPTHTIHDPLLPIEGAGWESDRVGYRVYLDKRFVTDIYGKKLPTHILNHIGQGGPSYHDENDWGMDIWGVGDSLGAGGLGVLRDGMVTQLGDMKLMTATMVAKSPILADIRIDADGWMFAGKPRALSSDFTISVGSRLSLNNASAPGVPLVAGFAKHANTDFIASPKGASAWGYVATWGRQSDNGKDDVGAALFYPIAEIARTGDDGRSYYVLFKNPAHARWAFAAAWEKEGLGVADPAQQGLTDEASFRVWLERTAEQLSNPVRVTKRTARQ